MSLIDTAETAIAPYLTWIKMGAWALGIVGLLAGGFYAGYRWEEGDYLKLKAADAAAQIKAVQLATASVAAQDKVNTNAAVAEAQAQTKIQVQTVTTTKEVPYYVANTIFCTGPTVGLARVLYAAAAGADPATLSLAPGQSDNDCSDVTPTEVASWFIAYADAAKANSEQLDALEGWIAANHAAQGAIK